MTDPNFKIQRPSTKDQYFLKTGMFIRANGKTMKEMAEAHRYGKMAPYIKDIGRTI